MELSQKDIADKLEVSQTVIGRYETDRVHPSAGVIKKYVESFDANPLFLLNGEGAFTLSEEKGKGKQLSGDNAICDLPLSRKIQLLRIVLNKSQKEFAEATGVSQAAVSRYEKLERVPDAIFLSNIVEKFGVNTDWLLSNSIVPMFKNSYGGKK